jgi:phosphatidylserine decarboxylase|tara:strand:- start:130030 stop:130899 length:870 start_codon:yes stop_codon:yes gene_type:complete
MRSLQLKLFLQYTVPKIMLSAMAGMFANIKITKIKNYFIRRFIQSYDVVMGEAVRENAEDYVNFNDFFTRYLKPGVRPIADADVVSPVDGCVSEIGHIQQGQLLQAKGRYYSVGELLACDAEKSAPFQNGSFATLYLSPRDYHRVHMPVAGTLQDMIHVPGTLFSVQPDTVRHIPRLFARNERVVLFFETSLGPMAVILVGATIVGKIGTCWHGDLPRAKKITDFKTHLPAPAERALKQADEVGYFKLGSTAIVLFAEDSNIEWTAELKAGVSVRLGEALGQIKATDIN